MTWFLPHNFDKKRPYLEKRQDIIRKIRRFFEGEGFYEVETPILQVCPTFDTHIHGIEAGEGQFLRSSPEFDMKKLMVAGVTNMYQIGPCFRKGEHSKLHRPEFTMLEWYRADEDYRALMEDCRALLKIASPDYKFAGKTCNPNLKWNIISVREAFDKFCKIDLLEHLSNAKSFAQAAENIGIRTVETDGWDDIFHAIMAEKIEPFLGIESPCILYDYPISMAALSRPKPEDPRFAERFEVYVCGVELANAFSELTDAKEQTRRFQADMKEKQKLYGVSYPPDEDFFKALDRGLPKSAGIALGIDRLIMLACNAEDIDDVRWVG